MRVLAALALALLAAVPARGGGVVRVIIGCRAEAPAAAGHAALVRGWRAAAERATAPLRALVERRAGASARVAPYWIAGAFAASVPRALADELARRPDVSWVEDDAQVRLEPVRAGTHAARGDPDGWTWGLVKLAVPDVRRELHLTGAGVRVGLIDSGVDATHPDLAGRVVAWRDVVAAQPDPYDDNGHGTHCAGTIAGGATSGRAIGVAPGAKLLVAKAFTGAGTTTKEMLLAAMQWIADPDGDPATADQPRVCSCSWHGGGSRKALWEATKHWVALGILPVFAQGNDGPGTTTTWVPAGYPESLAVGATDDADRVADFSSRGPMWWEGEATLKPDLAAPGVDVYSAKPGGGYQLMSGTSMATPHMAGVAALLIEARPDLAIPSLRAALEGTCHDLGAPGKDNDSGYGRADALAAAQRALRMQRER